MLRLAVVDSTLAHSIFDSYLFVNNGIVCSTILFGWHADVSAEMTSCNTKRTFKKGNYWHDEAAHPEIRIKNTRLQGIRGEQCDSKQPRLLTQFTKALHRTRVLPWQLRVCVICYYLVNSRANSLPTNPHQVTSLQVCFSFGLKKAGG
jgi:hypothetical protein